MSKQTKTGSECLKNKAHEHAVSHDEKGWES